MIINFLVLTLTFFLMAAGLIGSVIPILPGPAFLLAGALLYAWHTDFTVVSWSVIVVLGLLALFSQVLDYLASITGAKRLGASRWGVIGAFAGGIIGIWWGIPGVILGPFLGAVVSEIIYGKGIRSSIKIGFGTFIGFLGGTIGRLITAVIMTGIFLSRLI